MEGYERYESSERSEILEHRHDRVERSPRLQMGDGERAETRSPVVRNWALLDGTAVRADFAEDYAVAEINDVMDAADEIRNDNITVARILYGYAYYLGFRLGPLRRLRDVLRFKPAFSAYHVEMQFVDHIDRSKDLWVITDYISKLKEKEDIVNLDAEEEAAWEGRAREGEYPLDQPWRTVKPRRFYEILGALIKAAAVLEERGDFEMGSSRSANFFGHSSEEDDLVYLDSLLFYRLGGQGVYLSHWDIKRRAANVSKLHDEILARDLKQFLTAKTPEKFGGSNFFSRFFGGTTSSSESSRRDLPMAEKLLNLCVVKVGMAISAYSAEEHLMNSFQCFLLIESLRKTRGWLESIDHSKLLDGNPVVGLGELLQTLHDAQILLEASCMTTESQWPRAAFEQGDMNHTFARVFSELKWLSAVLLRMVKFGTSQYFGLRSNFAIKNDGQLSVEVETSLWRAVSIDTKALKHRLRSVKVADPTKQELVGQLLNQMEASSSDLVFQNLGSFNHKNAPFIGSGSFGAVVETTFLGMDCAMKVMKGGRGTEVDREFEKEMNAVQKLGNHPHLVRLYCYSKTNDACYLIMERMQMNLAEVLRLKNENGNGLSVLEAVSLMLQIGEGLKHIHSMGAAHRDLKPGNILVNLADPLSNYLSRIRSVKIADFGLTKTQAAVVTCSNHTRNTGTSVYMAPEVMKLGGDDRERTRFNPAKADVYSFGVVCSEILTRETPYQGLIPNRMKEQVKAGTLRPNLPTDCPPRLTTLIKRCWAGDYAERPLLPEVCEELRCIKGLLLLYMDRVRHRAIR